MVLLETKGSEAGDADENLGVGAGEDPAEALSVGGCLAGEAGGRVTWTKVRPRERA